MKNPDLTVKVIGPNPHRPRSITWRAGQIVCAMEGCSVSSIVNALAALEEDTTDKGRCDPARWLTHFAGLESSESGKNLTPWIKILHRGTVVDSPATFLITGANRAAVGTYGARAEFDNVVVSSP